MSYWAEDPELFLHKGGDGVVRVLRCKKEMPTLSSSSMLMKPEDFTDEGVVTDRQSLTGSCHNWNKDKYDAMIDYIYPRHLLVNCHGSVIIELEVPDEKTVFSQLFSFFFLLFHWLLVNLFRKNKKATSVVYMRALDILDMGCYGPGADHPGRAVPVRTVKYLQDGMPVQAESTPDEMKSRKVVETLRHELLLAKQTIEAELDKEIKLEKELVENSFEIKSLQQELLHAKEETVAKSNEVETLRRKFLQAKEQIEMESAKKTKLMEELAKMSHEIETLEEKFVKEKNEVEDLMRKIDEMEIQLKWSTPLPVLTFYTKAAQSFSLTIRNGNEVVLANTDPADDFQCWVKDDKYGDKCSANENWNYKCYALVNKSTGQALKPGVLLGRLEMVSYNRSVLDKSILWTEEELSDGYRVIRKAEDRDLILHANGKNGRIGYGATVKVSKWGGGDNQKWYRAPYTKPFISTMDE